MLTRKLIDRLQALVDAHAPYVDVMGEHQIMFECYDPTDEPGIFEYRGLHPQPNLWRTPDCVYDVLGTPDGSTDPN